MFLKIKYPLAIYLSWRLVILLYQLFLQPLFIQTLDSIAIYQRIFLSWTTYWDAGHYIGIATHGYQYPQQAFFPLWPLLLRIFWMGGIQMEVVVYVVTFILGFLVTLLFYLLGKKLIGEEKARLALLLFAVFPSSMFLLSGYSESLFLTLVLLSFLLLEKKRYVLSAIAGGLAGMTRLAGLGVALSFMFIYSSPGKKVLLAMIGISGLITYMLYLYFAFGNPLLFMEATKEWCKISSKCELTFPLTPLINYGNLLLAGWVKPSLSFKFLDWFFAVVFLFLSFKVWKKLGLNYYIYSLTVILLPLLSGSTVGMVRYVLAAFPIFFLMPSIIRSKILFFIICFLLFLLQLRFVGLFSNKAWVA